MNKKISTLLCFALLVLNAISFAQAPYASYPMDGNADDTSSNNLDGDIYGAPTPTTNRFNQAGKALSFNGSTDYIVLPEDFDFANRTVSVWFNATQTGSANGYNIIYASDHPGTQYGLTALGLYDDPTLGNTITTRVDFPIYKSAVNLNQWYNLVGVRTTNSVKFYVNGGMVYQGTPNNTHSNNTGSTTAVIGADRGFLAKFFGKIDDLEIYNRALSDCEISQKYFAGAACTIIDTVHIAVTDTLYIDANLNGVPAPNDVNTLKAYPNPAKTHLVIDNGNYANMSGYSLKITNALGQDEFSSLINQQQFTLDINTWSGAGVYTLYILNPGASVISTKKIIIQ